MQQQQELQRRRRRQAAVTQHTRSIVCFACPYVCCVFCVGGLCVLTGMCVLCVVCLCVRACVRARVLLCASVCARSINRALALAAPADADHGDPIASLQHRRRASLGKPGGARANVGERFVVVFFSLSSCAEVCFIMGAFLRPCVWFWCLCERIAWTYVQPLGRVRAAVR